MKNEKMAVFVCPLYEVRHNAEKGISHFQTSQSVKYGITITTSYVESMCLVLLYLLQRSRRNDRKALSSHGSNGSASPAKSLCRRRLCSLLILASIVGIAFISVTLPAYFLVRVWNLEISQFQELQLENSGEVASVFLETSSYADGFQNISSVDYMACCGAGHRLSKMADAYYLSKRLNFALRGYWGYCDTSDRTGSLTEVFQYVLVQSRIRLFQLLTNNASLLDF